MMEKRRETKRDFKPKNNNSFAAKNNNNNKGKFNKGGSFNNGNKNNNNKNGAPIKRQRSQHFDNDETKKGTLLFIVDLEGKGIDISNATKSILIIFQVKFEKNNDQAVDETKSISKQKKEKKEIRKKGRKNYDLVTESKTYWEQIRDQNTSSADRTKLISELLKILNGQIMNLIRKHDGSRVLQTCLKWGNRAQRDLIIAELFGNFRELSKDKYSHYLVMRSLKYATKPQRSKVIAEFYGKIVKLIKHSFASQVLDYYYNNFANKEEKFQIISEFYGPEFALFKKENKSTKTLGEVLEKHPEKKDVILRNIMECISPLIDKNLFYLTIAHSIASEYYQFASHSQKFDFTITIHPHIIHFLKTKPGTEVGVYCVDYANAKQRKAIIKSLKGEVSNLCREEFGHLFIIKLLEVTDDTVLISKSVLTEISKDIDNILNDRHGRLVALNFLSHASSRYFTKYALQLLQPTMIPAEDGTLAPTSKKDPEVKRQAHLKTLSPELITFCAQNVSQIFSSFVASGLLLETALRAYGDKTELFEAILAVVFDEVPAADDSDKASEKSDSSDVFLTHMVSSRILKQLIKTSNQASPSDPEYPFGENLLKKLSGRLLNWVSKKGSSFVVAALLEHPSTSSLVKSELSSNIPKIKKLAESEKGAEVIYNILSK